MAEPAQNRDADPASTKLVDKQIVISLTSELRERIEDFRFLNRYNSISAAVRYLIEKGFEAEGEKVTPLRKPK
mgnify:CR=1 FL=1